MILELAVRGKLVPHDSSDEPASKLIEKIQAYKTKLIGEGKLTGEKQRNTITNNEKNFPSPPGWHWVRFCDYATDVATGPFGSMIHQSEYIQGGVPLINPSHMIDDTIVSDKSVSVTQEKAKTLDAYAIYDGDVVMARRGDVGRIALVTKKEHGWLCGTGSFVLRFHRDVPREYLRLLFRSKSIREFLVGESVGTTMVNLNHGILKKMPICLPPLAEQIRIVAKVNELMLLCDQMEAQHSDATEAHEQLVSHLLGTLTQSQDAANFACNWQRIAENFDTLFTTEASIDTLKQTLLQLAVMGKLVVQDASDEPASELLNRIQAEKSRWVAEGTIKKEKPLATIDADEIAFDLPANWQWIRLGTLVEKSGSGWSPSCEGHARAGDAWGVLKVSAVSWGKFLPDENKALPITLEPRLDCVVEMGDFLITRANTEELVARSVVVENCPPNLMLSDKIVRLRLSSLCNNKFINLVNLSPPSRNYYALAAGGTSSSMKNVTREQILNLVVGMPPLAEQQRIVAKVDELMTICDQLKSHISTASQHQKKLADVFVGNTVIE